MNARPQRLVNVGHGIEHVPAPSTCPRCDSSMLDAELDWSSHRALKGWYRFKVGFYVNGTIAVVLTFFTLGLWMSVWGIWWLAIRSHRNAQKLAATAAASACVLSICRACGLKWFPREEREITVRRAAALA